ncbi:uncharacterized protein [Rutidosis leptorrhynchoides]|uniref:uncharacterized protein n=1 Tax=Rutidosis leptorrhynchoides TaxID=125765 RepID=UPI003A99176F
MLNALATYSNLVSRGISLPSSLCPFCNTEVEDLLHLFVKCKFVVPLWKNILSWWNSSDPIPVDLNNAFGSTCYQMGSSNACKAFYASRLILLWLVWKWRNKLVHSPSDKRQSILNEDVLVDLKILSFLWLKNRSKLVLGEFEDWRCNPLSIEKH